MASLLSTDTFVWSIMIFLIVLSMHVGYALLEMGVISKKNQGKAATKRLLILGIGGLLYWLVGYALSFGQPSNWFMGYGDFAFSMPAMGKRAPHNEDQYVDTQSILKGSTFITQLGMYLLTLSIVTPAFTERITLTAYIVYLVCAVIIFPLPTGWCWRPNGFLARLGSRDFGGACSIHVASGSAALVGTVILGPRSARLKTSETSLYSSPATSLIGLFMLTIGWFSLHCGATLRVENVNQAGSTVLVTLNTLLSMAAGGIFGICLEAVLNRGRLLLSNMIVVVLAGIVSTSGIIDSVSPWEASCIAAIGSVIALAGHKMFAVAGLDDPVGTVATHGIGGVWGCLVVGLFSRPLQGQLLSKTRWTSDISNGINNMDTNLLQSNLTWLTIHHTSGEHDLVGLFYGRHSIRLLLGNALATVIVPIWVGGMTGLIFGVIKLTGELRYNPDTEFRGADSVEHSQVSGSVIKPKKSTSGGPVDEDTLWENVEDDNSFTAWSVLGSHFADAQTDVEKMKMDLLLKDDDISALRQSLEDEKKLHDPPLDTVMIPKTQQTEYTGLGNIIEAHLPPVDNESTVLDLKMPKVGQGLLNFYVMPDPKAMGPNKLSDLEITKIVEDLRQGGVFPEGGYHPNMYRPSTTKPYQATIHGSTLGKRRKLSASTIVNVADTLPLTVSEVTADVEANKEKKVKVTVKPKGKTKAKTGPRNAKRGSKNNKIDTQGVW